MRLIIFTHKNEENKLYPKPLERSVLNIDRFKYYLQYIVMKFTSFVGVKAAFLE